MGALRTFRASSTASRAPRGRARAVGDDEQVLEKAYAWVHAQKPTSVGDIVQFNLVDDLVNALDLPHIPKTKLLAALKPQMAMPQEIQMGTVVAKV